MLVLNISLEVGEFDILVIDTQVNLEIENDNETRVIIFFSQNSGSTTHSRLKEKSILNNNCENFIN